MTLIRIEKSVSPEVLKDNKQCWTDKILDTVAAHNGYNNIPKKEKNALLARYKHVDIQKALFESSYGKCAYCECKPAESGYIEIDHFAPKSIYPDQTFEWDNLLPACKRCNSAKYDFDTVLKPIVNPELIDPEAVFTYNDIRIVPIIGTQYQEIADRTRKVCNLNSPRLYEARAKLLISLRQYRDELEQKIDQIDNADTEQKKNSEIVKLRNSLDIYERTLESSSLHSGYCRWFAKKDKVYTYAKSLCKRGL